MTMDEDSDSAPEDITFNDAKNDALEQMKIVSEAAKQKKELRKEVNKKRQKILDEQKQKKVKKIKNLESKKLPEFILDSISAEESVPEEKVIADKRENTKITFHDEFGSDDDKDIDEFEKDSEDFIALETAATKFKVVTKRDLNSSKFKSSEAFNFREKMLFGSRVKREPYKAQILKRDKMKVCGKAGKVGLQ